MFRNAFFLGKDLLIMTTNVVISNFDHLQNTQTGENIRIIMITGQQAIVCGMDAKTKLDLYAIPTTKLVKDFHAGTWVKVEDSFPIIDVNSLPVPQQEKFNNIISFLRDIDSVYGPLYLELVGRHSKFELKEIRDKWNIEKSQSWRHIIRWLQSGRNPQAFLVGYKKIGHTKGTISRGRLLPNGERAYLIKDSDKRNMDEIVKSFLKSGVSSFADAYKDLLQQHYSVLITTDTGVLSKILPEGERPSLRQFWYYAKKVLTPEKVARAKKGEKEVRNNKRVFRGSALTDVVGPGDVVEMDAHEMDVSIVSSEYPDICVGRPILYLMIDVWTRLILAVSVALDNNSVVGCTNCFANLIEDKKELVAEYCGTSVDFDIDRLWPSYVYPNRMRYDHGSDFVSNEITRIMGELKIDADHVPPGMGSMKGVVERVFEDIEKQTKDLLEKKGLIRPVYGSKHHKESCLDINDVMGLVCNYVLYHNGRMMQTYQPTRDMMENKVKTIPSELWEYGMRFHNPRKIRSKDLFLYSLLKPYTAKINRTGIIVDNLHYFPVEEDTKVYDIMSKQGNARADFKVRLDLRDVGYVYYLQDGKLRQAKLQPLDPRLSDYYGMSVAHYEKLMAEYKKIRKEGQERNLQAEIDLKERNRIIVDTARKVKKGDSVVKDLRESREREKAKVSAEHSVDRFIPKPDEKPAEIPVKVEEKEPVAEDESVEFLSTDTPEERQRKAVEYTIAHFWDD